MSPADRPFRSIWFDCDSTLASIEGVDELCRDLDAPLPDEIRALTEAAMNGEVPVESVFARRLALIRPTTAQLQRIGELYVDHAIPFVREVVAALRAAGKTVGIVSGGLEIPVLAFARWLGIQAEHVRAVATRHGPDGGYRDYDRDAPTARTGGKPELLAALGPETRPIAFVGDGATDLEARHAVELFVGFGGVVRREVVAREAPVYIEAPDLRPLLDHVLTEAELDRLRADPTHASLLQP